MDRVGACNFGRADYGRNVQVAVGAARGADADVLVRKADVEGVLVGFGVHRHGLDPELATRVDDAHRDLTAVGDQDFLEHGCRRVVRDPAPTLSLSRTDGTRAAPPELPART